MRFKESRNTSQVVKAVNSYVLITVTDEFEF